MTNTMMKATNLNGELVYIPISSDMVEQIREICTEAGSIVHNTFKVGKMPFEELPEETQNEVKDILKAFHRCTVSFEYGKFSASTGSCIKALYNHDHFVCGEYTDEQVYTIEERRQNYKECFGYSPCF